jgi:uracil-DNA glycosylase
VEWKQYLLRYNCIHDNLYRNIDILYENDTIYPEKKNIFRAFDCCTVTDVKVVLMFQDPYHNGSATGIATGVDSNPIPTTLQNIFKEIKNEYGKCNINPNLLSWCKQGVLLLNTALTVEKGSPGSHINLWRNWTANFIKGLSSEKSLVWVFFGKEAIKYNKCVTNGVVLECVHPAAEAYSGGTSGFFGSDIFKTINSNLHSKIIWHE